MEGRIKDAKIWRSENACTNIPIRDSLVISNKLNKIQSKLDTLSKRKYELHILIIFDT